MKSRNKEMTAKAVLIALLVSTAASPFQSSMASSKSAAKKISVTLNKKTLSLKTGQRFRLKAKKTGKGESFFFIVKALGGVSK